MIDIREMSAAALTELNERGREWRAKNSPDPAANPGPIKDKRHSLKIKELEGADPDTVPSRLSD